MFLISGWELNQLAVIYNVFTDWCISIYNLTLKLWYLWQMLFPFPILYDWYFCRVMTFYYRISKVSKKPYCLSSLCDTPLSPLFLFISGWREIPDWPLCTANRWGYRWRQKTRIGMQTVIRDSLSSTVVTFLVAPCFIELCTFSPHRWIS